MSTEAKKASFRFNGYVIKSANITYSGSNVSESLTLEFAPKGVHEVSKEQFTLYLAVHVFDSNKAFDVSIESEGKFDYEGIPNDKLSNFLIQNAPAILFPYIRAYISTLTSLSGIPNVLLPTLNMKGLSAELKENIKVVSD